MGSDIKIKFVNMGNDINNIKYVFLINSISPSSTNDRGDGSIRVNSTSSNTLNKLKEKIKSKINGLPDKNVLEKFQLPGSDKFVECVSSLKEKMEEGDNWHDFSRAYVFSVYSGWFSSSPEDIERLCSLIYSLNEDESCNSKHTDEKIKLSLKELKYNKDKTFENLSRAYQNDLQILYKYIFLDNICNEKILKSANVRCSPDNQIFITNKLSCYFDVLKCISLHYRLVYLKFHQIYYSSEESNINNLHKLLILHSTSVLVGVPCEIKYLAYQTALFTFLSHEKNAELRSPQQKKEIKIYFKEKYDSAKKVISDDCLKNESHTYYPKIWGTPEDATSINKDFIDKVFLSYKKVVSLSKEIARQHLNNKGVFNINEFDIKIKPLLEKISNDILSEYSTHLFSSVEKIHPTVLDSEMKHKLKDMFKAIGIHLNFEG